MACAANSTGEWEEQAYISTSGTYAARVESVHARNSGLGPFDASRAEALELGRVGAHVDSDLSWQVLNVSLKCTSKEPPHLAMEPVSGVAEARQDRHTLAYLSTRPLEDRLSDYHLAIVNVFSMSSACHWVIMSLSLGEVVGPQLHFFQSVVHAEWEPFVAGSLLRAQLVLPDENNSAWAHRDQLSLARLGLQGP